MGAKCEIWAEKNRHSDAFIRWPIVILFGKGVSNLYAYKEFLEGQKVLKMSGAGFWSLQLPDQEVKKARGESACLDMIKENLASIKEYVSSMGGFMSLGNSSEPESEDVIQHVDLGDEMDLPDLTDLSDGE